MLFRVLVTFCLFIVGLASSTGNTFDSVRVAIRAREAASCLPPSIANLVEAGLRVAVDNTTTVSEQHRARFAAVLSSRLDAGVPLCRAYAATVTLLAASWLRTEVAQPTSAFVAYCQRELGREAAADLPLEHTDPLLRCLRSGMRAALLFPDE